MKNDHKDRMSITLEILEKLKPLSLEDRDLIVRQLVELTGLKVVASAGLTKEDHSKDKIEKTAHSKANEVKTLLEDKNAKTDMEKLIIILYYLEEVLKEKESFSSQEISEMARMAGVPIFKRITGIIGDIKQKGKGWITTVGKTHKLSNKGLKYVLAMPNHKE